MPTTIVRFAGTLLVTFSLQGCATVPDAPTTQLEFEVREQFTYARPIGSNRDVFEANVAVNATPDQNALHRIYRHSTRPVLDWTMQCDSDDRGFLSNCVIWQSSLYSEDELRAIRRFTLSRTMRPPEARIGQPVIKFAGAYRISPVGQNIVFRDCRAGAMCGPPALGAPPPPPPPPPRETSTEGGGLQR